MWLSIKHTRQSAAAGGVRHGAAEAERARSRSWTPIRKEIEVRAIFTARADDYDARLRNLPTSWEQRPPRSPAPARRPQAQQRLADRHPRRRARAARLSEKPGRRGARCGSEQRAHYLARAEPADAARHALSRRRTAAQSDIKRNNFLALVFCLMLGTAALPHILMRYYTTPSVHETPRVGVLDAVLHPADLPDHAGAGGAGQVRHLHHAGRQPISPTCPPGSRTGPMSTRLNPLISIVDVNHDGIVQLAEIAIDGDMLVLATPEIAGLPYVHLRPGRGRRPGGRAVDRRRPAADDLQRAVARRLLQDGRPARLDRTSA